MRRDKNDIAWQECKKQVFEKDQSTCCLCKVMTTAEYQLQKSYIQSKQVFANITTIDPAHHLAVSQRPDLMYDVDNVYCLCRWHHDNLDRNKNPFDQEPITNECVEQFWSRIVESRKEKESAKLNDFFYDEL